MDCANPITHIIRRGDTLYKIARQYNTSVQALLADNEHLSVYNLTIGEPILICTRRSCACNNVASKNPRTSGMNAALPNPILIDAKTIEGRGANELSIRLPAAISAESAQNQARLTNNTDADWPMPAQVELPRPNIPDSILLQDSDLPQNVGVSSDALKLIKKMRELWMEYIIWTRLAIMGEGSEQGEEAERRLMRNPSDMARLFKSYYGASSAAGLEKLMIEHIGLLEQFAIALQQQDYSLIDEHTNKLKENTRKIAEYVASLNPFFDEEKLKDSFNTLLDYILRFDAFIATKQFAEDVAAFDEIEKLAMGLSDYLADGIIKQFHL